MSNDRGDVVHRKSLEIVPASQPATALWSDDDELQNDVRVVCDSPVVRALLEAVDGALLVINAKRQIVAGNSGRLGDATRGLPIDKLIGLRPGEALQCRFGSSLPEGCGTGEACRDCGAFAAIAASQTTGKAAECECILTVGKDSTPLELRVRATPITIQSRQYTVVSLRDISHEKRREALEQVFFHDLLNTISALSGWAWALGRGGTKGAEAAPERLSQLVQHLGREVGYQRTLLEAERGTLRPERVRVDAARLLGQVKTICAGLADARKCALVVEAPSSPTDVEADEMLLQRVLINMVKNALEASPPGATVRLSCEPTTHVDRRTGATAATATKPAQGGTMPSSLVRMLAFRVHNEAAIPDHIAPRVFQRSFSTKPGKGRGLGTYSMKLLGERYLGGIVSFTTSQAEGTTFSIELPSCSP